MRPIQVLGPDCLAGQDEEIQRHEGKEKTTQKRFNIECIKTPYTA